MAIKNVNPVPSDSSARNGNTYRSCTCVGTYGITAANEVNAMGNIPTRIRLAAQSPAKPRTVRMILNEVPARDGSPKNKYAARLTLRRQNPPGSALISCTNRVRQRSE
jgi:hypothetical protein